VDASVANGATSGRTHGSVSDLDWRDNPNYSSGYLDRADAGMGLLEIAGFNFRMPGDSGSVVHLRGEPKTAIARLSATDANTSLAISFRRVLEPIKDKTKTDWDPAPAA
jgi:hypothetical protein